MNFTGRFRLPHGVMASLAAATLGLLGACGSGGGGGGVFVVQSTIFGYDPITGNFDASGQQGEAPLIPLNMCVVFDFSDAITPATASQSSIVVQELDTTVTPPAPGPLAAATFSVSGKRLTICPLITFTDTNATFGWGNPSQQKTYQILFQIAPSPDVLTSVHGKLLSVRDRGPYVFKTSTQIFDQNPGAPVPSLRLLDHVTKATLPTAGAPFDPVPDVEITFDEPVIPSSAVDPGGVGTSPNIVIELDRDGNPGTDNVTNPGDRILLPGTYSLTETNTSATVLWTSLLTQIPTDLVGGCLYVVTVIGRVSDLSGNTLRSTTNPGANDVFTFTTSPGPSTRTLTPVIETFDTQARNDLTVTSAKWGTVFTGFLTPGIGGGTGVDGSFDPANPAFQTSPPSGVTVNVPNKTVSMSTETVAVTQRQYEFTSYKVPSGWTVTATGRFPLLIQCSGNVTVTGTMNLSGAPGVVIADGTVAGGAAGAAKLGGAGGGRGGATTDSAGASTFFTTKGGAPFGYGKLAFGAAGIVSQGVSSRNTALDTANFTLTDANFAATLDGLNAIAATLWIQPNVGSDDYRFERFHAAFKVESIGVSVSGEVKVVSNANDPNYRGELSQETANPWLESDGSGGLRAPLLSEKFDAYVIGELVGFPGGSLFDLDLDGAADDAAKFRSGAGSDPQSVVQTFLTLGHSGGGGGGGASTAGENGSDDPTVANGPGFFGGTGNVGGAGGAAGPTATLLARISADTFRVTTPALPARPLFDDGTGNPDPSFVGQLVNPNVNQGNVFRIASVNDVDEVTIVPVTTSAGTTINLNNTSMTPGNTVRVTPPYNAGGTGGGGAGVHCAGSSKTPASHYGHPGLTDVVGGKQNDQGAGNTAAFYDDDGGATTQDGLEDTSPSGEAIFALPRWSPGGGGGAGGGVVEIVAAGNIDVAASAQILVEGGEGGRSDLAGVTAASGGGGGAGGTIFLGAGGTLSAAGGAKLSCAGGLGGAQGFGIEGGDGAAGRIRLENALGNLLVGNFAGVGTPPITLEHLGLFPGGGNSIAQSTFFPIGALSPHYTKVVVNYRALKNGTTVINGTYVVLRDGTIDPTTTLDPPPFSVRVSTTSADPNGFADAAAATAFADPHVTTSGTPLSAYDGKPYLRFRLVLGDATTPIVIGLDSYSDVRIDAVELHGETVKP